VIFHSFLYIYQSVYLYPICEDGGTLLLSSTNPSRYCRTGQLGVAWCPAAAQHLQVRSDKGRRFQASENLGLRLSIWFYHQKNQWFYGSKSRKLWVKVDWINRAVLNVWIYNILTRVDMTGRYNCVIMGIPFIWTAPSTREHWIQQHISNLVWKSESRRMTKHRLIPQSDSSIPVSILAAAFQQRAQAGCLSRIHGAEFHGWAFVGAFGATKSDICDIHYLNLSEKWDPTDDDSIKKPHESSCSVEHRSVESISALAEPHRPISGEGKPSPPK